MFFRPVKNKILNAFFTSDSVDLDPHFYTTHYPDLKIFTRTADLVKHYLNHGRAEGRFPSLEHARSHYAEMGRKLPPDFNVHLYGQLNPDLKALYSEDWQFELHFLQSGASEGRPYKVMEADRVVSSGRAWISQFRLHDFMLFSTNWRKLQSPTLDEALTLFEEEGVKHLCPLSRDWTFDPNFYKLNYNLKIDDHVELYNHFLHVGFSEGFSPNEQRAISPYLGKAPYPLCFDWVKYFGEKRGAVYPAKIIALSKLFEEPLSKASDQCIEGDGAAALYLAIADFQLIRGNYTDSLAAYDRCLSFGAASAPLLRRADAQRALQQTSKALLDYRSALQLPGSSVWALIHYTKTIIERGSYAEAFAMLLDAKDLWAANPHFHRCVDDCINARSLQIASSTRQMLETGDVATANEFASRALSELSELIGQFKGLQDSSQLIPHDGQNRVVILACLDLPQCKHYRVDQKVGQLKRRGFVPEVFDFNDPTKFMDELPGAVASIFYRVPAYPKIMEAILYARSLGVSTFYDIDDLVFTTDFPDSFESYEEQISFRDYIGLRHGVPLYQHAIKLCDYGLASTKPLQEKLQSLVRRKQAFVIANGLDDTNRGTMSIGATARKREKTIRLFYGSGTKAHNRDFNELLTPALIEIFETYPQVQLVLVGHISLGADLAIFEKRIERFPFIGDANAYHSLIASCDINLAVLQRNVIADCKSEIKWLEAAVLRVPSIVSNTSAYENVLVDGHDVLMAANSKQWLEKLRLLIERPDLSEAIGANAREKALNLYSLEKIAYALEAALPCQSLKKTKPRILICNVYFAPETFGGATRVVESNVDYFIDHYSDRFEIFMLATGGTERPGHISVDNYRGRPVFRISTPAEINMDWRPFNAANIDLYQRVLDILEPDLVHFHCIQRLTASIVEETLARQIPYIVTVHDAWWISDHQFLMDQFDHLVSVEEIAHNQTALPEGVSRLQSIERRLRFRGLLNSAYAVLAVSHAFKKIYVDAAIANVRTCENGLSDLPAKVSIKTSREKLRLGHIGGNSVHKGAALVEIVLRQNLFENIELVMIDHSMSFGEEIKTRWGATEVFFRGGYPQDAVNELYGSIDVLLAPSIWPESFGLVAREAIHYGKWLIASSRGAIGEIIGEGKNGFLIDVADTRDLTRVLRAMNDNISFYQEAPALDVPLRTSDQQAIELAEIYSHALTETASPYKQAAEDRKLLSN